MSRQIFEYVLEIKSNQTVQMPQGAWLLSVANQGGKLCLWAIVDIDCPPRPRQIELLGTREPMPHGGRWFIGTVAIDRSVWHVFEKNQEN